MKYIFVINPASGSGKGIDKLKEAIARTGKDLKKDFEIYITKSIGDAEEYVRQRCMEITDSTSFIACGGDADQF